MARHTPHERYRQASCSPVSLEGGNALSHRFINETMVRCTSLAFVNEVLLQLHYVPKSVVLWRMFAEPILERELVVHEEVAEFICEACRM